MLEIVFKNLEPSELANDIVKDRIAPLILNYPSLANQERRLTLEMHNSPNRPGSDLFTVSSLVMGATYRSLKIQKSAQNFYIATAELVDGLNELLSNKSNRIQKMNRKSKIKPKTEATYE